ncbi:MAG: cell division protein FtsZ [Candidatus Nealsonbacteria bacterium CG_4_10_14_0_2_um_filter_38_17]|uniref:Cell division protein FtsZ n=2 Tax=Candidatus Nealsoniibacteriota TaxID=1817911 RepID=A0A2M7UXA1_9BACT|nr:MAG: cell division protein FtsZ [Candidatus Nealsonbacteria bacterium CG23_combo_of_CG06-09_8_20_14_all_38_19]PIZ88596.1 MAG: cell division protein FtsZ [Candidatus Nealsonbacteria bacterium CG_4_10_14_0_2_um_filter_38_17]
MKANTKIKVVGVGGSGSNAVSRMMRCKIKGVELIAINTDTQDLNKTRAHIKIRIGKSLTKGLGSGMNPEMGRKAAEEQQEDIKEALKGSDMIFVTCGLGGGTGTGASPIVAQIAKESGALTMAVVTKPFSFEGAQRQKIAESGLRRLKENVDTLIAISNDKLISILDPNISLLNAFWACDEILQQAVQGISDLIVLSGIINVDFADVKAIMAGSGSALFGIGRGQGEKRAESAALQALNSPLLDVSCKGAKGVLFNVSGGRDIALSEIDEVAQVITREISPEAKVIFGAVQDEKLKKGEIKVTVIATGF